MSFLPERLSRAGCKYSSRCSARRGQMMQIVTCDQYVVRKNWLHFPKLNLDPIQIPFGLGVGRTFVAKGTVVRRQRLNVQTKGRRIPALEVETSSRWRAVLPTFSRTVGGIHRS